MAYILENSDWKLKTPAATWRLADLVAQSTLPFYLYDLDDVVARVRRYSQGPGHVHYAMKANAHDRLLRVMCEQGVGVDVVSLGEMQKALRCGFAPKKIIFSGVAKDREELSAALASEILQINCESFEELQALAAVARERGVVAEVAVRLNIHLAAPTHKHIQTATEESKFGLDLRLLPEVLHWLRAHPEVRLRALAVHIGSQILDVSVFEQMALRMGELFREVSAQGFPLQRLDLGGGLGIDYLEDGGETDFARLESYFRAIAKHGSSAQLVFEPGRFLVARMGVLLAKVVYVKRGLHRRFAILNAGMNALMRPALYQAFHRIEPVSVRAGEYQTYDVVGPICESTDILAEGRSLPPLNSGDWVAVFDAGAYGAAMANTYNESPLPRQWSVLDGALEVC